MKIFDNSNLAESYAGVTTPLTFSFARYVYQEVYKNFCVMMGVSKKVVEDNTDMFPEMVVYIGGCMYYDLTNWYRLVSFLPGYSFNKDFFEEMLGVDKKTNFEKKVSKSFFKRWFFYLPKTVWQIGKILFSFIIMGSLVKKFNSGFDAIYHPYNKKDLSQESEESLKEIFNRLTTKLVVEWKVPIANDFAVMVSTGIVHKLFTKWLKEEDSYMFLYTGSTLPLISLDPSLDVMNIVTAVKEDKEFSTLFSEKKTPDEVLFLLNNNYKEHSISKKIFKYITKYGDRMPGELKLESKSLGEHPELFIQIIQGAIVNNQQFLYKNIERLSLEDCGLSRVKYTILSFFLNWAKKSIQLREETRFKRTLIFGFARKIFIEFGKKYVKNNLINSHDDIFYLTIEEIIGGSISTSLFKDLIQIRKEKVVLWKTLELPRRIETEMSIVDCEDFYKKQNNITRNLDTSMNGMVVSTGNLKTLKGEVIVMKEFDALANFSGKIVVTSHTDPGWSLVFPLIQGLVVEHGGMLSHAAIVARELGIPCIVGVENATDILITGHSVTLNLDSGEVYKKDE